MKTTTINECIDHILTTVGKDLKLGLPLGLGKPNEFVNALYARAKSDSSIKLTIYTALSLERPKDEVGLKGAFINPILKRVFDGYLELDYMKALRSRRLPSNIRIHEFFFKSGSMLGNDNAQQNYLSSNYTHVCRDLNQAGINVLAQMISSRTINGTREFSLGCNPEISLDLIPLLKMRPTKDYVVIGQVNNNLPFMTNSAMVDPLEFDYIIDPEGETSRLFSVPNMPVQAADYMIGLYCSALIADGGTLQIGIGSLGDAIAQCCIMRHQHNDAFKQIHDQLGTLQKFPSALDIGGGLEPFDTGLYGCSEMLVNGLLHLFEHKIVKRKVYHHFELHRLIEQGLIGDTIKPEDIRILLENGIINKTLTREDLDFLVKHGFLSAANTPPVGASIENGFDDTIANCLGSHLLGGFALDCGFFLGPKDMYDRLRNFDASTLHQINMTNISFVNHLYGEESLKRLHRKQARFINTVFLAHALGAATSDGLEDGQVVSGVGGQYNFVAQANELEDARSILILRSTRTKHEATTSNIVWNYGHTTIPRHLRDIYITEYGIADVRGKSDSEVAAAMINIADSRFQSSLVTQAIAAGKLPSDYQIPAQFCHNTPENITRLFEQYKNNLMPKFPFGSDLTNTEQKLAKALQQLELLQNDKVGLAKAIIKSIGHSSPDDSHKECLSRLGLTSPRSFSEKIIRRLLMAQLESS